MKLYYNPISTYSQKTLMAFYEKGVDFTPEVVNLADPAAVEAYQQVNPYGKVPTLVLDDGWKIPESSIIIEYLDTHFDSGTRLIPEDKDLARQTRFFDRLGDLYLNDPMVTLFFDGLKPAEQREPARTERARKTLDTTYRMMNQGFATRTWALGDTFSMADCAAAPALAALRQVYPYNDYPNLVAFATRVTERPSFQRVMQEALPAIQAFLAAMQQK